MDEPASRVVYASDAGRLVSKCLRSNAVCENACAVGHRRDVSPVFAEQVVERNDEVEERLAHAAVSVVGTRVLHQSGEGLGCDIDRAVAIRKAVDAELAQ